MVHSTFLNLPEHLILGIQTASYNLPYKHEVLKKSGFKIKILVIKFIMKIPVFIIIIMMIVMKKNWKL